VKNATSRIYTKTRPCHLATAHADERTGDGARGRGGYATSFLTFKTVKSVCAFLRDRLPDGYSQNLTSRNSVSATILSKLSLVITSTPSSDETATSSFSPASEVAECTSRTAANTALRTIIVLRFGSKSPTARKEHNENSE